jgi:hypothetical protein
MINEGTDLNRRIPESSFFSRIRRNHGLEHATLHVLSQLHPKTNMAGHSDTGGFWIIGDVPIEDVYESVEQALTRLRAGEENLAIHRNCGTNFVTAGVLAGSAAGLSMLGAGTRVRDKLERLPLAMLLATAALILAQPLGFALQERVTTSGKPGELRVVEIVASRRGRFRAYRVATRG